MIVAAFLLALPTQTVPVPPVDALQAQTGVASFAFLEPKADDLRSYYSKRADFDPAESLVDKDGGLDLTVVEMTVLIGGMRSL